MLVIPVRIRPGRDRLAANPKGLTALQLLLLLRNTHRVCWPICQHPLAVPQLLETAALHSSQRPLAAR